MRRFVLLVLLALPAIAFTAAGTDKIAERGKAVLPSEFHDWPDGTLDLINDPLRTDGWHHWFSELPNDVYWYDMKVTSVEEINHLIKKLAAIKAPRKQVMLSWQKEVHNRTLQKPGQARESIAVEFTIGNQKRIDEWFKHLKVDENGLRKFGIHTYTEAPKALVPTLTIYVANEVVDLTKLQVPREVDVMPAFNDNVRRQQKDNPIIGKIDKFVVEHRVKQDAIRKP